MAITTTMNNNNQENISSFIMNTNNKNNNNNNDNDKGKQEKYDEDEDEHELVMPGFRFYPTEEELIEFYLRRKVEGKHFHVELITFLDLYRHDPWELPALAAIGEKEWYFYVPRDKKYRNGDRPNRVTTSGYWKATGADRMIRSENNRAIGLKKTLVFYTGKAPKGIRTSWIMNEYRLPHPFPHSSPLFLKAEISLCRVYKRAGIEDHPSVPRSLPMLGKKTSSLQHHHNNNNNAFKLGHQQQSPMHMFPIHDPTMMVSHQPPPPPPPTPPPNAMDKMAYVRMNNKLYHQQANMEEISLLVDNHQALLSQQQQQQYQGVIDATQNSQFVFTNYLLTPSSSSTLLTSTSMAENGVNYSERLWEWNPFPDHN